MDVIIELITNITTYFMPNITKRFHKNYDEIEKKRVLQKGYNFRKFAIVLFVSGIFIQIIFMRTISIYLMGLLLALCSILFLYGYFLTSLILYKKKNNG